MGDNNQYVAALGNILSPESMAKVLHEFARAVVMCQKNTYEQRRLAALRRMGPQANEALPESITEVVYRAQLRNFYNALKEMNVNFELELDEEMALIEERFNARHGITSEKRLKKEETPEKEDISEKEATSEKKVEYAQESDMDDSEPEDSVKHQNYLNDISAIELLLRSLNSDPNEDYEFAYKVLDDLDTIDKN